MGFPTHDVDLPCPDCGEMFTGPPQVAGKARVAHRIAEHGYVRPKKSDKGDAPPRPKSEEQITSVSVARTISDAGKPTGAAAGRPPTRSEWEKKLGTTVGLYSVWRVTKAINASRLPEQDQERYLEILAFDSQEELAIASPFAGVIADGPLKDLNKKYGRNALDVLDVLPAAVALMSFEQRMRNFQREFGQQRKGRKIVNTEAVHNNGTGPFPSYDEASQATGPFAESVPGVHTDN